MFKGIPKADRFLTLALMIPMGLFCLAYVLFKRDFAEMNVQFSFLDFPIFAGEVLLIWCFAVVFFARGSLLEWKSRFVSKLIVAYIFWLLVKALSGYWTWGPLAFRHAALFYYPLFFAFGYLAFRKEFFSKTVVAFLLALIISVFIWRRFDAYWSLTLGALAGALLIKAEDRILFLVGLSALLACFPYSNLFQTARMMFVANVVALTFFLIGFIYLLSARKYLKVGIVFIFCILITSVLYVYFIKGLSGRVFPSYQAVVKSFQEYDQDIQRRLLGYTEDVLPTKLYNPENGSGGDILMKMPRPVSRGLSQKHQAMVKVSPVTTKELPTEAKKDPPLIAKEPLVNTGEPPKVPVADIPKRAIVSGNQGHVELVSVNNIVFRLLIWRDMAQEWWQYRAFGGFDFGRPLRSPSLEVTHWAEGEWSRDGWIEPHNSFLNIIYRSGVVGFCMVALIFWGAGILVTASFKTRSWEMFLLTGIVLSWVVAANFLLIFELPYTAVPFWTLFGISLAYRDQLQSLLKK